ncbi:hypothetical protein ACMV8I_02125 [Ewingella sp. S1.OA.A_B6]
MNAILNFDAQSLARLIRQRELSAVAAAKVNSAIPARRNNPLIAFGGVIKKPAITQAS